MKFSTRQDTNLPAESLFRAISDFDSLARILSRRGASVRRTDGLATSGVGMAWLIGFDYRGRSRELTLEVTGFRPPELVELQGNSDQFDVSVQMTVVALTKAKSRLIFETVLLPRGLKARLILQTVKLGKPQLDRKFAKRVAEFVDSLALGGGMA